MASAGRTAGHHLQEPLVEDHDWPTPVLQVKLCVAGFFVLGTVWLALDPKIGGALAILAAVLGTLLLRHDPGCRPCMNGIIGALPLPCPAVGLCGACEGGIACVTPFLIVSVATAISGLLYTLTLSSLDVSSIFIIRPFIALLTASLGVYAATLAWHIRNGDTTWRPYGGPGGPDYFEASVASAQLQRAESPPGLELPWEGSSQTQHRAAQPLRQQQQQQQQQQLQQQEEEDLRLAIERSLADGGTGTTAAVTQAEDSGATGGPRGPMGSSGEDNNRNVLEEESASDIEIEISDESSAESGNSQQKDNNEEDNNNAREEEDNNNDREEVEKQVLKKQVDVQHPEKVEEDASATMMELAEPSKEIGEPMTEEECARGAARVAVQTAVAAVHRRLPLLPTGEEVCIYTGFTEHAYRQVFPFEDRFAPDAPRVLTVMPSGVIETNEVLTPQKEDALIAFTYPQSISDELAESQVSYKADGGKVDSFPMDSSPSILRNTAFVWRREDGTNALVQTWPTSLNEQFRKTFEISEGTNPNPDMFQPQAVSEFQESMTRLFGPAAAECPILFCHKKTVSTSPAVTGLSEEVLAHIKEHPELMRELAILSIDSEGLGFVADGTSGDGKRFEQHFTLTAGEHCVVYRKVGWESMGCIKPLHQFLRDAELHEPPTVKRSAGMNENESTEEDMVRQRLQEKKVLLESSLARYREVGIQLQNDPDNQLLRQSHEEAEIEAAGYQAEVAVLSQNLNDVETKDPEQAQRLAELEEEEALWAASQKEVPLEVCVYPGFTEHAYRLVFPFEDRFAPEAPHLLTVMPSGVVETNEILKPQKENALIAFTYPQSISDELAESPVSHKPGGGEDENVPTDSSPSTLRDTAFVWRREDGTNALVQTWPTSLNEQFRKTFEISEGTNPDSEKFQPQAVSEFQESMVRLFGPAAATCPVLFCHKKTVNTFPAVAGVGEKVLAHIKEHPELMRELAILSIDSEGLGFVSDGACGDGKTFEKHFTATAGEHCVVYRKVGWESMGCIKPLHQFLRDAELHEPPTVKGPAAMNENVAAPMGQEEDAHDGPAESLEIMVRLPNGRRMRQTFQSTDKVAVLYEAVDAECNESGIIWPGVQYLLATSHPRSAYNNRDLTLAQAGIANQVMLHIERPKPQPQQ